MKGILAIIIAVVIIGGIGSAFSHHGSDGSGQSVTPSSGPTTPPDYLLRPEAEDLCHKDVAQMLKAPDTVKWDSTRTTGSGLSIFRIRGLVSSENGFGALVQSIYSCEATFVASTPDGDQFSIRPHVYDGSGY